MRRDQPNECDTLEQRMRLKSLQELSCDVTLADILIHDKLRDPPNDTWDDAHERSFEDTASIIC